MKTILVGNKEKFYTIKQVFDIYQSGCIRIILQGDIADQEDIVIPKKIKKLHIYSQDHVTRKILHKGINIYIQGRNIILEDIRSQYKDNGLLFLNYESKYTLLLKNMHLAYFYYQDFFNGERKHKNEIVLHLCEFNEILSQNL